MLLLHFAGRDPTKSLAAVHASALMCGQDGGRPSTSSSVASTPYRRTRAFRAQRTLTTAPAVYFTHRAAAPVFCVLGLLHVARLHVLASPGRRAPTWLQTKGWSVILEEGFPSSHASEIPVRFHGSGSQTLGRTQCTTATNPLECLLSKGEGVRMLLQCVVAMKCGNLLWTFSGQ